MKSLLELTEASKDDLPEIYCDLDEVLVNFLGGIMEELHLRRKPEQDEIDDFLATAYGSSIRFWSRLGWMPDGRKLWDTLKDLNTEILTACPHNCQMQPSVVKGKKVWCAKNLNLHQGVHVPALRKGKMKYAGENHILIDDYIKNINEWTAKGGIGIHHKSARKTLVELKKILLG